MLNLAIIPILESIFYMKFHLMKFLGMNIAPMLNPLKFSITTPLNSQNMQTELTAVQVF